MNSRVAEQSLKQEEVEVKILCKNEKDQLLIL